MIKTLRIQLTDVCNLKCVYCCNEGTKNDYSILKDKNLKSFIRAAHDVLKINKVKFTGGEPLEYDESISNIIRTVQRPEITYSIVTNATNYAAFKNLISDAPSTEVTISLPVPPSESYLSSYKFITGAIKEKSTFRNLIGCIDYMTSSNSTIKINYVLCKDMNTSSLFIKEMIDYSRHHPSVQLRFLETVVNDTNNQHDRMSRYVFTQKEFERVLNELGYQESVKKRSSETRSSCIYNINGLTVKFIKFFCENKCDNCPEDKTSLWLTSTGYIKRCSFRSYAIRVDNWQYDKIAKQLESFL